jgi:hypothetical protein
LRLVCDELLSTDAHNFTLRRYNEDACFNRCPKNARCIHRAKTCACDIGYVMQGMECFSVKDLKEEEEDLPLPGEVPVKRKSAEQQDYDDPVWLSIFNFSKLLKQYTFMHFVIAWVT